MNMYVCVCVCYLVELPLGVLNVVLPENLCGRLWRRLPGETETCAASTGSDWRLSRRTGVCDAYLQGSSWQRGHAPVSRRAPGLLARSARWPRPHARGPPGDTAQRVSRSIRLLQPTRASARSHARRGAPLTRLRARRPPAVGYRIGLENHERRLFALAANAPRARRRFLTPHHAPHQQQRQAPHHHAPH